MQNKRSERGAISILVLVSLVLFSTFLMSTYIIISNKVKTQKEIIEETKKIYEVETAEEAYNSFLTNKNTVIPIYTNEQYLNIATGNKIEVDGKYYNFTENDSYILINSLEIKEEELPENWIAPEKVLNKKKGNIDYNGNFVIVKYNDGTEKTYNGKIDGRLPKGYTELEYIESTGEQYIDTGVVGKSGIEIYADMMYIEVPNDGSFIGARTGGTRFYLAHSYPNKWGIGYENYYSSNITPEANTKYSIYSKLYNGEQKLEVNGTEIYSNNIEEEINTNLNLYIFGMNYNRFMWVFS